MCGAGGYSSIRVYYDTLGLMVMIGPGFHILWVQTLTVLVGMILGWVRATTTIGIVLSPSIQAHPLTPLYYVRSGNTNIRYAGLRYLGGYGYLWSSVARAQIGLIYIFAVHGAGVNSLSNDNSYDAFLGRC